MKALNKKGQAIGLGTLKGVAVTFVVVAIVLSISGTILSDIQDDQTTGETDWNATDQGLQAIETLASWLDTLALVIVAVVVIGVLGFLGAMGAR